MTAGHEIPRNFSWPGERSDALRWLWSFRPGRRQRITDQVVAASVEATDRQDVEQKSVLVVQ